MSRKSTFIALAALCALAASSAAAGAELLPVSSYDMPNGDGQAHGGTFNYWDATYDGTGLVHRDGLSGGFLSAGTGALTDGVIATHPWDEVSNTSGTGEEVGWLNTSPTITFHFADSVDVGEIRLYVDNSHIGGVTAPSAVVVNGLSYGNPAWQDASLPETIDLTGLHLTGNTVTVQLVNPAYWVFMSEAQFISAVPEPATGASMLAGLGLLSWLARRRRGTSRS